MSKKYLKYILLAFLTIPTKGFGQQSVFDSLFTKLHSFPKSDLNYIKTLTAIGLQYQHINVDSMIVIGNSAINASKQINYIDGEADGYKLKGIAYYILQQKKLAIHNDTTALNLYIKSKNNIGQANALNNLGVLYDYYGEYNTGLLYYKKSLAIRIEANDIKGQGDSYANIANTLLELGNYTDALHHILLSLQLRKQINNQVGVANSYMNLGNIYYQMHNLAQAKIAYGNSIKISNNINNFADYTTRLISMGAVYYTEKKYDSASMYYNQAYQFANKTENQEAAIISISNLAEVELARNDLNKASQYLATAIGLTNSNTPNDQACTIYNELAVVERKKKNYNLAIKYALHSYNLIKNDNNKLLISNTSMLISSLYEENQNLAEAFKYYKIAKQFSDSIYNEKNSTIFNDLSFKYEVKQKEDEIQRLELDQTLQREKSKNLEIAFALLIIILLATLITLYVLYVNRKKEKRINELVVRQKNTLEQHNQFKNKIFTILAHDLRAPVASVLTMHFFRKDGLISDKQFLDAQDDIATQIRNLSFLVDNLLRWAKNQMTGELKLIKTWVNVDVLIQTNKNLFKDVCLHKHINIVSDIDPRDQLFCDNDHLDIILRNLISNALKFSPINSQIIITFSNIGKQSILVVQDFGTGMDEQTMATLNTDKVTSKRGTNGEQGTGIGLTLCNEFTEMNEGKMIIESKLNQGTKITLSFPNPA